MRARESGCENEEKCGREEPKRELKRSREGTHVAWKRPQQSRLTSPQLLHSSERKQARWQVECRRGLGSSDGALELRAQRTPRPHPSHPASRRCAIALRPFQPLPPPPPVSRPLLKARSTHHRLSSSLMGFDPDVPSWCFKLHCRRPFQIASAIVQTARAQRWQDAARLQEAKRAEKRAAARARA